MDVTGPTLPVHSGALPFLVVVGEEPKGTPEPWVCSILSPLGHFYPSPEKVPWKEKGKGGGGKMLSGTREGPVHSRVLREAPGHPYPHHPLLNY